MNSFGRLFSVQIYGESHGFGVGILIDGCPPGFELTEEDFLPDLIRRNSSIVGTTTRKESDYPLIKSGIFSAHTTGAPIMISFPNFDVKSDEYYRLKNNPRPGHSDFTSYIKYQGYNDFRGGGHFSGRLTVGLVAAGVIAKRILQNIIIKAKVISVGGSTDIDTAVENAMKDGDSIGGIIECSIINVPVGLGEPFFDSLESLLSHIIFAIPAVRGIEFGTGFAAAQMKGSEHNDEIMNSEGITLTNNAGGINGGISNGNEIVFRVAIKPASSISKEQKTTDLVTGEQVSIQIHGRHDVCIALRAPVVVEAATAIVLADLILLNKRIYT